MERKNLKILPTVEGLAEEWKSIQEMDDYGYRDIVFARIQNFFDKVRELSSESAKRLADIIWPKEKL